MPKHRGMSLIEPPAVSKIRRGGRKGFTLIELLVVVAIIVILVSILVVRHALIVG